jgi:hypothetical protein
MFDRFRRSWRLAKASYAVLRADRELLVFPLVSFFALIVVLIGFAVPFALVGGLNDLDSGRTSGGAIVLGFLFYVVSYSVAFFFNTGLVGAAMIRLDGGDPTVRDGFRMASSRLPAIIGYAVIAATVGMVLRFISERAGFIGQIVIGILGFAWSIATFLVVPVLVVEQVGPLEAIKRSGTLLRKTWGEQLIGGAGIGIVFGLITVGVIVLGMLLTAVLASISLALAVVAVVTLILAVGAVSLIGAALSGIYTASLYRYATTGDAGAFGTEVVTEAFSERTRGGKGPSGSTR